MKNILLLLCATMLISCSVEVPVELSKASEDKYYLPFITTLPAQSVSLNEAKLSGFTEAAPLSVGDVENGFSNEFKSKGFIWGEDENINLETSEKVILNNEVGPFSATITSLKPNTEYFFNTYVIDSNNNYKLGQKKSFTTAGETPCSFQTDNYFPPIFDSYEPYAIDQVSLNFPSGFSDGNLEFETSANSSIVRIRISLNEIDANLPLTGKYKGVHEFNNQSVKSSNEMRLSIIDNNGFIDFFPQGGSNDTDTEFYIENDEEKVSFIFCNTVVGDYTLNGKFSYTKP